MFQRNFKYVSKTWQVIYAIGQGHLHPMAVIVAGIFFLVSIIQLKFNQKLNKVCVFTVMYVKS